MRWSPVFSVSETDSLAHRLELGTEPQLDLNSDLLDWMQGATGRSLSDVLTRYPSGIAGDLGAAELMVAEIVPDARWQAGQLWADRDATGASLQLPGVSKPFVSEARSAANALIAATLRAFTASQIVHVLRRAA